MRRLNFTIAGYGICFEAADQGVSLSPAERYSSFTGGPGETDLTVLVHNEQGSIPATASRVFIAPYAEEEGPVPVIKAPEFWSVWDSGSSLFLRVFPGGDSSRGQTLLKFSRDTMVWDLYLPGSEAGTDPLAYPLDSLIMYYLTAFRGDIFIHASGISYRDRGWLFSGSSGRGKTTLAGLWKAAGATVIHDDRLIIRRNDKGYSMHNLPVYDDEQPREARLGTICLISHGDDNSLSELRGAAAVTGLAANCIQHPWNSSLVNGLLGSLSLLCNTIPVYEFSFTPGNSAVTYLLGNEQHR